MYPFERYMKTLKGHVRNCNRPEACIVESYIAEEALEFCFEYIEGAKTIEILKPHQNAKDVSKGISSGQLENVEDKDLEQAHQTVLENTTIV